MTQDHCLALYQMASQCLTWRISVPFHSEVQNGGWLYQNGEIMEPKSLSLMIKMNMTLVTYSKDFRYHSCTFVNRGLDIDWALQASQKLSFCTTLVCLIIVHMYAHVPGRFSHYVRRYYRHCTRKVEVSKIFVKNKRWLWLFLKMLIIYLSQGNDTYEYGIGIKNTCPLNFRTLLQVG